jgi:integrase
VVAEIYRGERKRLKTYASAARVPQSPSVGMWLASIRDEADPAPADPVFRSERGTPLTYANVYNRVLRPALRDAGIAVKTGTDACGKEIWDYQGVAFHAFRKACGFLLLAHGKVLEQVQGWLRHSQLTTTMNVYIHQVDDGLGSAAAWDEILPASGDFTGGATRDGIEQIEPAA